MQIVPLSPVPNQRFSFRSDGVNYDAEISLRRGSLYISMWEDGVNLVHNRVLRSYAPMGDRFMMIDAEGVSDPEYKQLGTRYLLVKLDG